MWWTNGVVYNPDQVKQRMPDAPTTASAPALDPEAVGEVPGLGGAIFLDSLGDMFGLACAIWARTRTQAIPPTSTRRPT